MKKVVTRSSRDLSADNSHGKRVTRSANITPKKKTITPNASPASSSRRSSRKQTPSNKRKSVRMDNMKPSDMTDQSMTDPSKNKGQEKPSLGADGRKRKRVRRQLFSRVKQKRAVADADKAKDSEETSSEAITCSSSRGTEEGEVQPPEKMTNDDVSRKRKETTNNITESVASKPGTEEGEVQPPEKMTNDDVSRKRKETTNNIVEKLDRMVQNSFIKSTK